MPQHYDKHGVLLALGDGVRFLNAYGKEKLGHVTEILPSCVKVFTQFEYYVDGKQTSGEGEFPVVPSDCEAVNAVS